MGRARGASLEDKKQKNPNEEAGRGQSIKKKNETVKGQDSVVMWCVQGQDVERVN